MKVLLFGASGQVGQALLAQATKGVRFEVVSRAQADLTDPTACAEVIHRSQADLVLNAAAWTGVDTAEDAAEQVTLINHTAPVVMAQACVARGIPFVHLSSDYVLQGSGTAPQTEETALGPLSVYGRSKADAETGIRDVMQDANTGFAILRTSWVFSGTGANFVKTMLRLANTRNSLSVVGDQVGGPTSAVSIAKACVIVAHALVAGTSKGGIYNFAGAPDVSWAQFARAIMDVAGCDVTVTTIDAKDYPTRAARPYNSRLECSRIQAEFGIKRPLWAQDLQGVVPALTTSI